MEVKKAEKSSNCCGLIWHLFGVVFIAFGISLFIFFPDFFHNQLLKNLELAPDSRSFSEWKKPTVPLYMDIFLFNWTNPHEIKNKSTKPNFEQLGPYRFREFPDKLNVTFPDNNSSVSYFKFSSFFFDPDGSNGSLSDLCTTVNMVALGAGQRAHNWGFIMQIGVSMALSTYKQQLHVTKTVQELLFDGYDDDMVKLSTIFNNDTPFDRVGFLVKKNGTELLSGRYTVHTGVGDISQIGSIQNFNNLPEFPFYDGECKNLKGSAGEFFPPEPFTSKPIYLFAPEMCRALPYDYEKEIELHGVRGQRFSLGPRALDNGTVYNEAQCYATDQLMPSGVMNISVCNYGFPMFMSLPHFHKADLSYLDAVDGLEPVQALHESFITLEPSTGITLEVTARFQTNQVLMQYGDSISLFQNVPRIFMPIFWVEQKFVMDAENSSQIKLALVIPFIGRTLGIVMFVIGLVLISVRYLKTILCGSKDTTSHLSKANGAVIDYEINPLMSKANSIKKF